MREQVSVSVYLQHGHEMTAGTPCAEMVQGIENCCDQTHLHVLALLTLLLGPVSEVVVLQRIHSVVGRHLSVQFGATMQQCCDRIAPQPTHNVDTDIPFTLN